MTANERTAASPKPISFATKTGYQKMLFKSQVYTSVSGSIGGATYSHNKSGMYARGRSIPVNPNTVQQQLQRGYFAECAQAWGGLTQAQRDLWNAYAEERTHPNPLGDPIQWSGQQEFVAANTTLRTAGLATVTVPPELLTAPTFVVTTFSAEEGIPSFFGVATNALPAATNARVLLFGSRPISLGTRFFKGPYRLAEAVDAAAGGASWTTETFPFAIAEDQQMGIRAVYVLPDGRYTTPQMGLAIKLAP